MYARLGWIFCAVWGLTFAATAAAQTNLNRPCGRASCATTVGGCCDAAPCDCEEAEEGCPCEEGCCDFGGCRDRGWVWARADYLMYWTRGTSLPPLVTSGGTGVIGANGTSILYGNQNVNADMQSGGAFEIGAWFDPSRCLGFEANYLFVGDQNDRFSATSTQFPTLARPFMNAQTGNQDARLIGSANVVSGDVRVNSFTSFYTGEMLLRTVACENCGSRLDYVAGYRYAQLEDQVRIDEFTTSLANPTTGTTFTLFDQFSSRNTFHGAEVGAIWQTSCDCWSLEFSSKIALGNNTSRTFIGGQTITQPANSTATTSAGGLLALGTNSGTRDQNKFSALAEAGVNARRSLGCGWTALVGYRFLYWSDVRRAGNQIDTSVNSSQIGGTLSGNPRPAYLDKLSGFWAQGINLGLEYAF